MAETYYFGVAFPVVFSDGETETSIGDVTIYPETDFPELQLTLATKIGISPLQFSIFLSERRNLHRRKTPISTNTYFGTICQKQDCVFLVVLKRSRRFRRGQKNQRQPSIYFPRQGPPPNITLLRRDDLGTHRCSARDMLAEREPFPMSSDTNRDGLICEQCVRGNEIGRVCEFHRCVFDPVTVGFRSPAGPISRPDKTGV